jgi:hypothetical protein
MSKISNDTIYSKHHLILNIFFLTGSQDKQDFIINLIDPEPSSG